MSISSIQITAPDMARLRSLLTTYNQTSARDEGHFAMLEEELERANELDAVDTPPDLITMQSRVRVCDMESGQCDEYTLVYPRDADVTSNKVSILAPLGTALLGYREGDQVDWLMPGRVRRLRVEKVMYQPEAAQRAADDAVYDELDRRLMDTFPASDSIARYR